jgi:HTH-type transcriptional regulator/antitoxin HigA
MLRSQSYIAVPPSATIAELLIDQTISLPDFADKMQLSVPEAQALLDGDIVLTADLADRLEKLLGVPAAFWNRLEEIYRQKVLLVQEENTRMQTRG